MSPRCADRLVLVATGVLLLWSEGAVAGTVREGVSGGLSLDSIPVRLTWVDTSAKAPYGRLGRKRIRRHVRHWATVPGGLSWSHRTATVDMSLTLRRLRSRGAWVLESHQTYRRDVYVMRSHLVLTSPCDRVTLWDRSERLRSLRPGQAYHLDRWTARYLRIFWKGHSWSVLSAPGISGMTVSRPSARRCSLVLEIDDSRNHPAVFAARCKARWYPPSPRRLRARRYRRAGEAVSARIVLGEGLWSGHVAIPARLPRGYAAALVFTDHADQSGPGPLRALLLGRSDASVQHPDGGFLGHGLGLTKTLFWGGGPEPQFDDPAVRALAQKVHARGIEFGPHSATPGRDSRATTESALEAFRGLGRTWIDHQPDTNCEAYSSRGWREKSRFFLADLLARYGFDLVWTGQDAKPRGGLNMFDPRRPMARPALLFPFHVSPRHAGRLWLWRSIWFYEGPRGMERRLSRSALGRLVAEHGILVAHTYLDDHHPPGHRRHKMALVHRQGERWILDSRFDAVLARLERLQAQKLLWVPSFERLAAYLIGWNTVEVFPDGPGSFVVRNPGSSPLVGFGLWVRGKGPWSGPVRVRRRRGDWALLEMDLPAAGRIRFGSGEASSPGMTRKEQQTP